MKENFIQDTPLFAELSADEQRAIGKRLRLEKYKPNETLFVKDGESDALYLIKEGWVKIAADENGPSVANLGPGSLIGEADFFLGQPRTTTARATGDLTVWSLHNDDLATIIAEMPEIGLNLGLAFGHGISQYHYILTQQLANTPLLQNLSARERALIAHHLAPQRFQAGDPIFRSGDRPTGLYIIDQGAVRLLGDTDDDFAEVQAGEIFGEMSVIANKPHAKTAQAAADTIIWQLSPTDFAQLIATYPSIKTNLSRNLRASLSLSDQTYAVNVLRKIALFEDLPQEALEDVARLILLRHIPSGELVFSQGDPGDALYIVDSGTIEAVADNRGSNQLVGRFTDGDYFGEISLLTGKTRSFTAYATTEANLWGVYRTDFDNLLIKYPQLGAALGRTVRDRLDASAGSSGPRARSSGPRPHLQRFAALTGLSQPDLDLLAGQLQPRQYQPGTAVYYEGQLGQELYFIESGQLEQWATTMRGPTLLETLGAGDFCGEAALLSGRGQLSTAHVLVNSRIWVLPKAAFDDFLRRHPHLLPTINRVFGQRTQELLARLQGGGPRQALPSATGPGANPAWPAPTSPSPYPLQPSRPVTPVGPVAPPVRVRAVGSISASRPVAALPPRTSPVPPAGNPAHAQNTVGMRPVRPQPGPAVHSQHTVGVTPVNPAVHSQHTVGIAPVGPAIHSQHTVGVAPIRPEAPQQPPAGPKRKKISRREAQPGGPPTSAGDKQAKRKRKKAPGEASRPTPVAPPLQAQSQTPPPPPPPPTAEPRRKRRRDSAPSSALALQPRVVSNRRLQRQNSSLAVWFAKRSLGAKLRLLFVVLIIIWLCGIMAPSFIINSLAATFEDNGALPGDERSIVNQVRQDGAVGAVAMLPFVETATATPTETQTPTITPTPSSTPTETPIPTLTHTPTNTPTPTETPTPIFTPTSTATPTPAFTRVIVPSAPTDTPTPEPTPTPDVDFRLVSVRQLTPCENRGKHHIFVKVQDSSGQGINGVPVKIQWSPTADGFVVAKTDTKTDLVGQLDPGRLDFAMFKGTYEVEIQGATSQIATGITPDYGTNETCGEDTNANSLFHISYEVIFERTF